MSRYRFIAAQGDYYPVRLLCQLVAVPASSYYAWQQAQQQKVAQREPAWETALVKAFGGISATMVPVGCASNCAAKATA